jgi:hypothetical protein
MSETSPLLLFFSSKYCHNAQVNVNKEKKVYISTPPINLRIGTEGKGSKRFKLIKELEYLFSSVPFTLLDPKNIFCF